jgi:cell division protease FtsH
MINKDITLRKEILNAAATTLKKEFIGLNDVIENVINAITTWYLYPQLQTRPQIINLWGMTGTGKTSLVKRLSDLLQYSEKLFLFDMGSNSENISSLKTHFKKMFEVDNGRPAILAFDEFQYANTKDDFGRNIDKIFSRAVWDVLDTGKFQVIREFRDNEEIVKSKKELEFLLKKGVVIENGYVVSNKQYFVNVTKNSRSIKQTRFPDHSSRNDNYENIHPEDFFFASDDIQRLCNIFEEDITAVEMKDKLMQMNGIETLDLYQNAVTKAQSRKEIDCTKCLIFILGNLDDAYSFGNNINADADADVFYELSKSITIAQIKKVLQRLFKNEQIARLGNNHIIYPAFSKKSYYEFIALRLQKIAEDFKQQTTKEIEFSKSVLKLIYAEGVYPSQGTRPVLSTIQQHVEMLLSKWITYTQEVAHCSKIVVSANRNNLISKVFNNHQQCLLATKDKLQLQLMPLRKVYNDNQQSAIAVHESGHAVAHIVLEGNLPNNIFTITANTDTEGFVEVTYPKRNVATINSIKNIIIVALSGMAAEDIVFGSENKTLGSSSDIKKASYYAALLVKQSGVLEHPYYIDIKENRNELVVLDNDMYNDKVKRLIDECYDTAKQLMLQHKSLILTFSKRLTTHSHINKKQVSNILTVYNAVSNHPIKMVQPFNYKQSLLSQHQKIAIYFNKKQTQNIYE